jgi:hypothetical protein
MALTVPRKATVFQIGGPSEEWRPSEGMARTLHVRSQGTVKRVGGCWRRATALIEDIWYEKIRGCSYRGCGAPRSMSTLPSELPRLEPISKLRLGVDRL